MNVNGIVPGLGLPTDLTGATERRERTPAEPSRPTPVPTRTDAGAAAREAAGAVPAEPPRDVDPALWSVLTAEERSFFARSRAMGPLTYGPARKGGAEAGVAVGGRVDIRV